MNRIPCFLASSLAPLSAQWGADSQPTRTTAQHQKRVIGSVTQWDAWKGTSAGLPVMVRMTDQSPSTRVELFHNR
ncbi:MAG: hypothetical protein MUF04_09265 [Akkermansiaceae bacterium]|jgi:hypothetical protein|nr:hypothetical protein [Akkermansiaceae bacterium]